MATAPAQDLDHVFDADIRSINAQSEIYSYTQGVTGLCSKFGQLWRQSDESQKPALAQAFAAAIENQANTLPEAETVSGLRASAEMTGAMIDTLLTTAGRKYVPDGLGEHFMSVSQKLNKMATEDYGANVVHELNYAATLMENRALKLKVTP